VLQGASVQRMATEEEWREAAEIELGGLAGRIPTAELLDWLLNARSVTGNYVRSEAFQEVLDNGMYTS
jgi:hypothetical protein